MEKWFATFGKKGLQKTLSYSVPNSRIQHIPQENLYLIYQNIEPHRSNITVFGIIELIDSRVKGSVCCDCGFREPFSYQFCPLQE